MDLYLIHWPKPRQNAYVEAWKALVKLKEEGRAKSVGVSNFTVFAPQTNYLMLTGVAPSVNQIELHPRFNKKNWRLTIRSTESLLNLGWSPLGQGTLLENPTLKALAEKHGRTPAQSSFGGILFCGYMVIPKSVTPSAHPQKFRMCSIFRCGCR